MVEQKPRKKLKIDKHLPQILVPPRTRAMFMEWWNTDIRFEHSVPKTFESGYLMLDYNYEDRQDELLQEHKVDIKCIAKHYHCTYREAETMFKNMLHCFSKLTIYFTFRSDNDMYIELFDSTDQIIATCEFGFGKSEPEPPITSDDILFEYGIKQTTLSDEMEEQSVVHKKEARDAFSLSVHSLLCIIVTSMWYIATTKSTKYIYEKKTPMIIGRKKDVVKVSDTKTINTPIYDMGKVKIVKVEQLQTRKKGWTYSHSFQVHGHYRHYKSGKVIFVNSFVKGKDKEFKAQQVILEPKQS